MFNWRKKKTLGNHLDDSQTHISMPPFAFQPFVLMRNLSNRVSSIELVFDSNHRLDRARTVKTAILPAATGSTGWTVRAAEFESNIFDAIPGGAQIQQVRGQMLLDIASSDVPENPKTTLLLADMDFRLPLRSGTEAYEAEHIRSQVLNAVCRELTVALEGLHQSNGAAITSESSVPAPATKLPSSLAWQEEQKRRRWVLAACILSPLTVLAIVLLFGRDPEPAISSADLAAALTPNNEAIQGQVKMTQETLKAMGLDPGQAGDMGCLAPDQ